MSKKAIVAGLVILLAGCGRLTASAPPRFPQFSEYSVAGPGVYEIPQWSSDSRYLAFVDVSRDPILRVYDTVSETNWSVATNIYSEYFSWTPDGNLAYLRLRLDLSGSPYPVITELHQVDRHGENDRVIGSNLSDPRNFAWFSDGERIAILLTDPTKHTYFNDVYLLNVTTNTISLLLKAQDIGFQYIAMLVLSADEQSMLLYGVHEENGQSEAQIVIYNLETHAIVERIIPSQIIPSGNITYPVADIGDGTNAGWIGGQRWFLTSANTPGGQCYNYALFFFDTQDLRNSFCIPSVGGVFDYPIISPDLTRISYVTVVGPGEYYVMVGTLTSDLLSKLHLGRK